MSGVADAAKNNPDGMSFMAAPSRRDADLLHRSTDEAAQIAGPRHSDLHIDASEHVDIEVKRLDTVRDDAGDGVLGPDQLVALESEGDRRGPAGHDLGAVGAEVGDPTEIE